MGPGGAVGPLRGVSGVWVERGDGESGEGGLEVSRYEGAVTLGVSEAGAEEDDALAFADGVEDDGRVGVRVG